MNYECVGFIPGVYQTNKENYMTILLNAEKAFAKINIHSWIQNFRKLGIKGNVFNPMKVIS